MSPGLLIAGVFVLAVFCLVVFLSSLTFLSDVPHMPARTISLADSPPGERRALIGAGATTLFGFVVLIVVTAGWLVGSF